MIKIQFLFYILILMRVLIVLFCWIELLILLFTFQLSNQEDLIVWMRTAALPNFRKLYGKIEEDLDADDVVVVHLWNNYNTYSFGGKKKIVLSTSSWLGGKNDFLGLANLFVGSSCILISFIFLLLHVKNPRYLLLYTKWCRSSSLSFFPTDSNFMLSILKYPYQLAHCP